MPVERRERVIAIWLGSTGNAEVIGCDIVLLRVGMSVA